MTYAAPRFLRVLTAVLVAAAGLAWAYLAPVHAGGDGLRRAAETVAAAPCHGTHDLQEPASIGVAPEKDPGCASLCALAATDHFLGHTSAIADLPAVKAALPVVTPLLMPAAYVPIVRARAGTAAVPDDPVYRRTLRVRI